MRSEETRKYLEKYTKKERLQNWFDYHKWWLLLWVVLAAAVGWTVWQNLTRTVPDYQFAYVGEYSLPEDTVDALESALTALGEDLNGDGQVVFQVNQYLTAGDALEDGAMNQTAWETRLMADLVAGESYFFLLSDPEGFQKKYDVLEPETVSAGGLAEGLNGLSLARRGFAEGKEPEDFARFEALWACITEVVS